MFEESKEEIIKIVVSGDDEDLFKKLRKKLLDKMDSFLDTTVDYKKGTTIKEEAKELISLGLDFSKQKLKKAGIENEKLNAEIDEAYSRREKNKAETRNIDADTREKNFNQSIREFRAYLIFTKAILIGKQGEEAVILTKQIEVFLEAVNEIANSQKSLD